MEYPNIDPSFVRTVSGCWRMTRWKLAVYPFKVINWKFNMLYTFRITLCLFFLLSISWLATAQTYNLIIGTYTGPGKGEGIYVYSFDAKTGDFAYKNKVHTDNPSYLVLAKNKQYVYAVNELGEGKGRVSSFAYDRASGELRFVDSQLTGGDAPCHISIDGKGRHIAVSNYSGGSFSVFGAENNGTLSAMLQKEQYYGKGKDKGRQEKAHVHSVFFTPDNRHLLVQDLGADKIYSYPYDAKDLRRPVGLDRLTEIKVKPGSGPRHLAISKKGNYVYLVTEMIPQVNVYSIKNGVLDLIQEESILASNFKGDVGAADIKLSPDGKYLYATNRGDANDMTIFSVEKKTGRLSFVDRLSTLGKGPRNFEITPDGNFLLVGHQYTNDISIFSRDKKTGLLRYTGKKIEVGAPVCLVFDKP